MTFKQACDIIYQAVEEYCRVKSDICVESKFEAGNGFTFTATVGNEQVYATSGDDSTFHGLAFWIRKKRDEQYVKLAGLNY